MLAALDDLDVKISINSPAAMQKNVAKPLDGGNELRAFAGPAVQPNSRPVSDVDVLGTTSESIRWPHQIDGESAAILPNTSENFSPAYT